MKITKSQLKQIIKEELGSVLSEAFPGRSRTRLPGQRVIPVRNAPEEEESKAQPAPEPKPQPAPEPARVKKAAPKLPPHTTKMIRNSDGSVTATACTKDGKVCGKGTYISKVLQVARSTASKMARDDLAKKLKN